MVLVLCKAAQTWKILFSAPLCLIYSLGRNSFRLTNKPTWYIFTPWQHFCSKHVWYLTVVSSMRFYNNPYVLQSYLGLTKCIWGCLRAAVAACSHTEAYSRNPGLCLCSTWGPNWICAWIPPNSHALSKDTGWEPFKMSSLAWNTRLQYVHLSK